MLDSLALSSSQRSTLLQATDQYAASVYEAADFLAARGIGEAAALSFRLGVVSDPIVGHERFKGMLSIPYLTPAGTVAMKFRCVEDHECKEFGHPKYDAPSGQVTRMYNVAALHSEGDTVAICEGELDALVMTTVVGIPAVGIPGASNWDGHKHWARCFADYERVLVIADNDVKADGKNPGVKHAEKVVRSLSGARMVLPPAGEDLSSWVQKNGVDEVLEACGV